MSSFFQRMLQGALLGRQRSQRNYMAAAMTIGSSAAAFKVYQQQQEGECRERSWWQVTPTASSSLFFFNSRLSQCYAGEKTWQQAKKSHTNTYIWGNGFQVDSSQEFSNFSPKNIKNFKGVETPDIVDVAFGRYNEAYIDKQGGLYVCDKAKMSSIKIKEVRDDIRNPLMKVESLPRNAAVQQVCFTRQKMFVVTKDGKLYVFHVEEQAPSREDQMFSSITSPNYTGQLNIESPLLVKDLPPLKMIATGNDHLIMLDRKGQVWAMGDDTFGQCGQGEENRQKIAPFFEVRHRTPQKVMIPDKIVKVVSGNRHCLAISEKGGLYGWGFNSMQQLSHSDQYQDPDSPSHAIFQPERFGGELMNKFVVDAACGEEHSVIVCQMRNGEGKCTHELVYSCGNNLKGQLGINRTSHLNDWTLVEDLSEIYDGLDSEQKPLHITHISCGKRHCMATLDYGAFYMWGDNVHGQLGNRKRSFMESPFPKRKFELNHDVVNVVCGHDSSAVIVETHPDRPKKEKNKRVVTMQELASLSDAQIAAENEARVNAAKEKAKEEENRRPMDMRFRDKVSQVLYGSKTQEDEQQKKKSSQDGE